MAVDDARAPSARRSDGRLLEREGELTSLDALVRASREGEGFPVLIEGPAGIGKTRLLAELRRRLEAEGARVLTARGSEFEREFPFGVVRQLFEPVLVGAEDRGRLLAEAAAGARPVFERVETAPDEGPRDATFAALHGLYWLAVNVATDRPLLLAIDDLQWCDRPSLRYVAYLVRRLEGLPVIVAATLRSTDPGTDPALLAEIAGDPATVSIRPGPLSVAAVGDLVAERLGEEPAESFRAACHRVTGGNPLLLRQLLRSLEAESVRPDAAQADTVSDIGPRAVSRTILLRLARLPEDAGAVARATAVLGDGSSVAQVAALSGLSEDRAAQVTGALAQAEILRSESPLGFVHPLVREAIYQDVPPGEREIQHARAARLLAEAECPPERVAAHLLLTPPGRDPWVVDALRAAAEAAQRSGGAESAVLLLRRALEEPPAPEDRPELLLELGVAEAMGSAPAAAERLREAYEAQTEAPARGLAAAALTQALIFTRPPDEAVAVARKAASELPPELADLRLALEALEFVASHFGADPSGVEARFDHARTELQGVGPGARMLAAVGAWDLTVTGGSMEECVRLSLAALADGVLVRADPGFFSVVANGPLILADRDEALEVWDAVRIEAHRTGSLFAILGIDLWRGFTLLRRGELTEAESSLHAAIEKAELWGAGGGSANAYAAAWLGLALLERGDLVGAGQALGRRGDPHPHSDGMNWWLRTHVELLIADGRTEEAVEAAAELASSLGRRVNPAFGPWRSLKAQALDRLGRREEALALAREELEPARRWGAPGTVGRSLRVLGELEREQGLGHLEEAVATLEGSPARLEHAKALAALGTTLRLARRPTDAREPLRRALELAEVCGAEPLAGHVRSELYATGARPRTTALSGPDSLTPSERRIVDLAVEGGSNRDIAQALFVTPKTVEVHLSNAYRKLEISSRRELAGALGAS